MSVRKPRAVIAHLAGVELFDAAALEVLEGVATIDDPEPIGDWNDPRAAALLATAEVVIGHWGCPRLDGPALRAAPQLGHLAYAAGTVKQVVSDAVFERSVRVTSGALANAEPVAEFTLSAILFANKDVFWRRLGSSSPGQRSAAAPSTTPVGNWAKTIGILGASLVGRRVMELLRPFPHLNVLLYDPFATDDEAKRLGATKVALDELCTRSDVLSIHAPDLPSTKGIIGAAQLAQLRSGATVINTARPALVDQDALVSELTAGRLRAVLDVTDPEPLPAEHPLANLPNAFVTPHISGSEGTELARMAAHVADEIQRWASGRPALNEVTQAQLARMA